VRTALRAGPGAAPLTLGTRQAIILGVYLIIFGLGTSSTVASVVVAVARCLPGSLSCGRHGDATTGAHWKSFADMLLFDSHCAPRYLNPNALHRCSSFTSSYHPDPALTLVVEFQIPPQVTRYASFMFSFLGRGLCTSFPPLLPLPCVGRLS
jgi:hypothetical protein